MFNIRKEILWKTSKSGLKNWFYKFKWIILRTLYHHINSALLPDRWCVFSASSALIGAEEPHWDWTNGPLMTTGLVSGWSRAALRGLMELNCTTDRQPVKPREARRASSGSNSSDSVEGEWREWRGSKMQRFIVIKLPQITSQIAIPVIPPNP